MPNGDEKHAEMDRAPFFARLRNAKRDARLRNAKRDASLVITTGSATDKVPGDCDSVMILRRGVVSEIRPILKEEQSDHA